MASFQVKFYGRNDRGRLRPLKVVELPGGSSMDKAVAWAAGVLAQTTLELRGRVVELRVALVEADAPAPSGSPLV